MEIDHLRDDEFKDDNPKTIALVGAFHLLNYSLSDYVLWIFASVSTALAQLFQSLLPGAIIAAMIASGASSQFLNQSFMNFFLSFVLIAVIATVVTADTWAIEKEERCEELRAPLHDRREEYV